VTAAPQVIARYADAMPDNAPDNFDWVAAQSRCSAASMFDDLETGVKEDVQRRNALPDRDDGWTFEFDDDDEGYEVSRLASRYNPPRVEGSVRFELAGRRIEVRGEGLDVDITAVVVLDSAGVCRFVVGEVMYAAWEIRRMALEQLFFEQTEETD
jgi:hypothetical protein